MSETRATKSAGSGSFTKSETGVTGRNEKMGISVLLKKELAVSLKSRAITGVVSEGFLS